MKYLLSLLLAATMSNAYAQNSYLLEGTIGAYPVVMNLSYDDSTCGATYFYRTAKRDIQLSGTTVGTNLFLHAMKWNSKAKKNDTLETITLSNGVKDVFTGKWNNGKGEMAVTLHKVDIKNAQNPYNSIPYVKCKKWKTLTTTCV